MVVLGRLPESGRTYPTAARSQESDGDDDSRAALSFIRTVTVGPGIAPGLLTPPHQGRSGRSRARAKVSPRFAITAGGELHPALRTLAAPAYRSGGWILGLLGASRLSRRCHAALPHGSTRTCPP
ncbi:hypothetical protein VARIO8X_90655 [Burkholderiales bacterium 8X]|nr:hypothetical protein VARIO8X_90655 [Burkholderiales bacterium 8X]